jgi:hypothetical protein
MSRNQARAAHKSNQLRPNLRMRRNHIPAAGAGRMVPAMKTGIQAGAEAATVIGWPGADTLMAAKECSSAWFQGIRACAEALQ